MEHEKGVTRRRFVQAGGALGAMSVLGGTAHGQAESSVVVSAALRIANYIPSFVAIRRGLFKKHGLNVEMQHAGSIAEPVAVLNANRAQIALTGTGMVVNARAEGAKIKVIARIAGAIGLWVIARPGTVFKGIEDFKGKSVACLRFPSNTVSSPTYIMKTKGKFDPAQAGVKWVEGPPGSIIPAVKDGRADLGVVFEWDASLATLVHGLSVVHSLGHELGPVLFTSAMAREETIAKNPALIQGFCNALAESSRLLQATPGLYAEVAAQEFAQVPPEAIKAGSARLLGTPGFVPRNPVVPAAEWDAIMAHELGAGTLRQSMKFADVVDNTFAEKATKEFGIAG